MIKKPIEKAYKVNDDENLPHFPLLLFAEGSQVSPAEQALSVAVHLHTLFVESQNMPVVAEQESSDEVHLQVPESQ